MASEWILVLALFVTGGLAIAWKYPDRTKGFLNTMTKATQAFYLVLILVFAFIFLSSGMTILIVLGAAMITLLVLNIWNQTGSNPIGRMME